MNFPVSLIGFRRPQAPRAVGGGQHSRSAVTSSAKPATAGGIVHHVLRTSRATFWRVYAEWMSLASQHEVDQLEVALVAHAPHVRSIHAAIGDAMRDCDSSMAIPLSLLAALDAAGWRPDAWTAAALPAQRAA